MSVKFEWQFDAEEAWKTPEPPPERPRRSRWAGVIILLVVILGLTVAVGRFWLGVRQGKEALRQDLKAVANLEERALASGNWDAFLQLQDPEDTTWYARQEERTRAPRPVETLTLDVQEAALMSEELAWAEVAWTQEDGLYQRTQFYRRVDDRWLRTGIKPGHFGSEQTHQTTHFAFSYPAGDELTVRWMADQLEVWYVDVCSDLDCDDARLIQVVITPEGQADEGVHPPHGFTLHSPRTRGVRQDGAPLPEERTALARLLVYTLVGRWSEGVDAFQQSYLLSEFANWELRRLGLDDARTPPTPALDHVMETYGMVGVRGLIEAMHRTSTEGEALHLVLNGGAGGPDRFPWGKQEGLTLAQTLPFDEYLLALLTQERQLAEWQSNGLVGPSAAPLAQQMFKRLLSGWAGAWYSQMYDAFTAWPTGAENAVLPAGRPSVLNWGELDDETIWADVLYVNESVAGKVRRVEFFRQINGAWRHARPERRLLGDEIS